MDGILGQKLEAYLRAKLPQVEQLSVSKLWRIPGGASRETWAFDALWQEGGEQTSHGFILRRDPDASVLETERDLEFRVMEAVWSQGVPVPKMHWLEQDGAWLNRPVFVMDRIDGRQTSPQRLLMEPRYVRVQQAIARQFTQILARIHALDWKALGLDFLGVPSDPSGCAEMELAKGEAIVDREALEPQPVLRAAFAWLRLHPPRPAQRVALVHADYRTGNFLVDEEGEIKGVLDWEMAHLGDPLEDIAWACIRPWRWAGDERVGGLMTRDEFYRAYSELTGLEIDDESLRFWEVLGNVKLAAIFLTGGRSFCEGRTASVMVALLRP